MSAQSKVIRIRKTEYEFLETRRRQAVMAAGGVFVSHAEVLAELLREFVQPVDDGAKGNHGHEPVRTG